MCLTQSETERTGWTRYTWILIYSFSWYVPLNKHTPYWEDKSLRPYGATKNVVLPTKVTCLSQKNDVVKFDFACWDESDGTDK